MRIKMTELEAIEIGRQWLDVILQHKDGYLELDLEDNSLEKEQQAFEILSKGQLNVNTDITKFEVYQKQHEEYFKNKVTFSHIEIETLISEVKELFDCYTVNSKVFNENTTVSISVDVDKTHYVLTVRKGEFEYDNTYRVEFFHTDLFRSHSSTSLKSCALYIKQTIEARINKDKRNFSFINKVIDDLED